MEGVDRDYVVQSAKFDGEYATVKDVFEFHASQMVLVQESSFGIQASTTAVQNGNVDVLSGKEGVGPEENKCLAYTTALPISTQQHGKWKRIGTPQRNRDTMETESEILQQKRKGVQRW